MIRVLLLTDFSPEADNAIKYAVALFKEMPCEFVVLNVHKSSDFTTDSILTATPESSVYDSIIADNTAALNKYMAQINEQYNSPSHSFKGLVDYDVFTDAVIQAINQYNIDYLVMGTSGHTGLKESIFGSNVLHVIRQVACPLIVVPENYAFNGLNKVLFTQTQEQMFANTAFNPLMLLLKNREAQVHLLGIHPKDHKAKLDTNLESLKQTVFKEFTGTLESLDGLNVATAIDAYEQLHPIDLHVFFAQHESLWHRIIFGSQTSQIRHKTHVPLLLLNAQS